MITHKPGLSYHLTHKANLRQTRYGWLRLTPAYSVHLVQEILSHIAPQDAIVLDPFCGTGTTALVCAEKGITVDTTDINPFLLWLTKVKTAPYNSEDIAELQSAAQIISESITISNSASVWIPPIHQIERWWDSDVLQIIGNMMGMINKMGEIYPEKVIDLLKIAFCRVIITHSSASFDHQSMSFKQKINAPLFYDVADEVRATWEVAVSEIVSSARSDIRATPGIFLCDARDLSALLPHHYYTCVITSPPYPNRMSYIRELRPYMYWLSYLRDGREAGELDWKAIGGTWGIATSRVGKWSPSEPRTIPYAGFSAIIARIAAKSDILARYVHKYFYDMVFHVDEVFAVTKSGASIHYIVGNSKFYNVMVPVEEIFAAMFEDRGFVDVTVRPIRKRTSKKELYEYVVSARRPS
jgi:hypothetical protein